MITVYFFGWGIVALVAGIFAGIIAADSTRQSEKNMAWSLPFIGIFGGFVWPLAIAAALVGFLVYGGWHTARAVKHRGWDY